MRTEIKNYRELNFGYGRATRLTLAALALAYAEIERGQVGAFVVSVEFSQ